MNLAYFIAKRYFKKTFDKDSISTTFFKIATLAVGISVVVMIGSLAIGFGLKKAIQEKIVSFASPIKVYRYISDYSPYASSTPIEISDDIMEVIDNEHDISSVQYYVNLSGIIKNEGSFQGAVLKGVDSSYNLEFLQSFLVKGNLLSNKAPFEAMISEKMANELDLDTNQYFHMIFVLQNKKYPVQRRFKVTAIFNTGWKEFDENIVYVNSPILQNLLQWTTNQYSGIEINTDNFDKIAALKNRLYNTLGVDYDVTSVFEEYPEIFGWIELFDTNIFMVLTLMILVAIANIVTVLLILTFERKKMVAILKSIGTSNTIIRKIFIYKTGYILWKGVFWGNIIAVALLLILKYTALISLNSDVYFVEKLPITISLWHILIVDVGLIVMCYITVWIPSNKISKISPALILKSKD